MPIDFRQMMKYNHYKRVKIEPLLKPSPCGQGLVKFSATAGRGPALPALRKIFSLLLAINLDVIVAKVQSFCA
jgi:hypothetical protein